jgi:HK97 family phage prohead protease
MLRFTPTPITVEFADKPGKRKTISGVAVPYNVIATDSLGTAVKFLPGSLPTEGPAPKLYQFHDPTRPVGVVSERVNTDEAALFVATFAENVQAASEAAALVEQGVVDAVSVGAVPVKFSYDENNVMVVESARWLELSLVPYGAFDEARITGIHQIAAGADNNNTEIVPDDENPTDTEAEPETETENEVQEMSQEQEKVEATTPVVPFYAEPKRAFKLPSPAEYIAAFSAGGSQFAELNAKIVAAAPDITTADTPGILPEVITGSVYDSLNPIRPFVTAIGTRAMPEAGAPFRRPVISVRPVVTEHTTQLTALDPSTVGVANNDVSKKIFGTYVTMSEADMDWSDPASINIVLNQLAIAYGEATDNFAVDAMVTATTQTETLAGFEPGDFLDAIYGAAYQISNSSNYLPSHYFVNPVTWAKLGMARTGDGVPVFPFVGAPGLQGMNALGTSSASSWNGNPLGLTLVVDKNMSGGTGSGALSGVVGHAAGPAAGFEYYEMQKGAVTVEVPSVLGRTIAWRGYAAVFMADATKFVKIVNA